MVEVSEYTLKCDECKKENSDDFRFETIEQLKRFLKENNWGTVSGISNDPLNHYHYCPKHFNNK